MTVSSEDSSIEYAADGVTADFAIPFAFFSNAHIHVSTRDSAGDTTPLATGFTVTGEGTGSGNCNFNPVLNGVTIVIERVPEFLQQSDYVANDRFPAETNESDHDRGVLLSQYLYRLIQGCVRFPTGDASVGGLAQLPSVSTRKSKNLGFDSAGRLVLSTVLASGTLSQDSIGGFMWPRNAQEIAGSQTPVGNWPDGPILDMRRWMNGFNTGTNITAAVTAALAAGYKKIWLPAGHNLIDNVAVTANDVHFIGDGESSRLTVVNANSRLWNVTGQRFKVFGIKCEGDGTSTNSTNGVAAYLNQAGSAVFEDVRFDGFGFGGISGAAASALKGPVITRATFRNTQAGGNEIYLGGLWVGTVIEDPDCYSTAADRCLLMYDNSTAGPTDLRVRGGTSRGYLKQQWAIADENWDGTDRLWDFVFDGLNCNASNWSAIKCKTGKGVKVVHCTMDGCGLAQEDQPSGLYGDVLVNSLGKVMVQSNIFRNSGSAACRINGPGVFQYPGTNPGGLATDLWDVSHNEIDTCGVVFSAQGSGIIMSNGLKNASITHNAMRKVTAYGVQVQTTAASPFWDLGLFDNSVTDSPACTNSYSIGFGQSLRQNGNLTQNCGQVGVVITDVDEVRIGSTDMVLDPAITGGYGYQIGNVRDLDFRARCGNSTYTQWVALTVTTVGTRVYNGANVYEAVVAGTTGNAGGPIHTAGASTEGTVVWYYVGKYQLLSYGVRLVGTQGKVNLDFDPAGCLTGPIANLILGSGGTRIHYTTNIATANATPTNAQVIPLPDLSAWMVEAKVLAQAAAVPDRAMYYRAGLFYRNGAGTTLQGAVASVFAAVESNAAWDCIPAASGNNLAPAQVTGAAATAINWAIDITMLGMP